MNRIISRLISVCETQNSVHASGIYHHHKEISVGHNDPNRTRAMGRNVTSYCAECFCIHRAFGSNRSKNKYVQGNKGKKVGEWELRFVGN